MNVEERKEIEAMFQHHVEKMVERFEHKIEAVTEDFKFHIGTLGEDFQHKMDLVVEGHEVLHKEIREVRDESIAKHDHSAFLLKALNNKVDGIAADISAHRKDTEAHGAVWVVKEGD